MRRFVAATAIGVAGLSAWAFVQDAPTPEQIAAFAQITQPGDQHRLLEPMVGEWNVTMKMFMAGPAGPATETKGTSSVQWVLGGRFLEEHMKAEMMWPGPDGQMTATAWEGKGLTGYDNYKSKYVATWADSMGTSIYSMSGVRNPTNGVLTMYGEMDEPMLGIHARIVKTRTTTQGPNKHTFEMFDTAVADDYKVFEIIYERK